VRTRLMLADLLLDWRARADLAEQRRYFSDVIARPDVNEAILIASASLHASSEGGYAAPDSPVRSRVEHELVKYVACLAWRMTPSGLFAGRVGQADWVARPGSP
jgi:hypothetical protein